MGDSVALWIQALGSIASAVAATVAVVVAFRSQKIANSALQLESNRALLRDAENISAWWATKRPNAENNTAEKSFWGIVVQNNSGSPVKDVVISTKYLTRTSQVTAQFMPPGYYACDPDDKTNSFFHPIENIADYTPLTNSTKHEIISIKFTDRANNTWEWTFQNGLNLIRGSYIQAFNR